MSAADIFALPSRSEGIPNAVLEAMATGVPVVATAVGGVPEIIEDGVTGRLVPSERPDLLAQGLADVLDNPQLKERLVSEATHHVRQAFSVEARAARIHALYRDVLEKN
jgi:glycosyltransferase involved in cell wall biosynthesis